MDLSRATPEELKWRISQLEQELAQERQVRMALEQSTLWRLMKPLRVLLAPMSRLVRGAPRTPGNARAALQSSTALAHLSPQDQLQSKPFKDGYDYAFVEFSWERTARPCDISGSTDTRSLSVGFRDIRVFDSQGELIDRVDFSRGGNSLSRVCFGFSYIEPWGTWAQGREASVLLLLPHHPQGRIKVAINASPFEEAFSSVNGRVRFNGRDMGSVTIITGSETVIEFERSSYLEEISSNKSNNVSLNTDIHPEVSIIILNYNKPAITLSAIISILNSKTDKSYEIIVLDNGSSIENGAALQSMDLPVRLIRLRANRFFGEGNNIAAESARGEKLLFLNNDAFLSDYVIDRLCKALDEDPTVGAAGPIMTYPDGTMQEAGAFINADGTAFQRGKRVPEFDPEVLPEIDPVDYISAACIMLRRDDFFKLGGFDLRYDPAYYEDSDLCLRLLALGKPTVLVRDAVVRHIENATTSDPSNKGLATDIVDRHRQIFLNRWQTWLANRTQANLPSVTPLDPARLVATQQKIEQAPSINATYSPYPLVQGGGERYLLGTALALAEEAPTAFVTPDEYSNLRLNTLMAELGYPTGLIGALPSRAVSRRNIGVFVLMGNELLPTRPGQGKYNVYHCQFPFPVDLSPEQFSAYSDYLRTFNCVVVNSEFTRTAYLAGLQACGISGIKVEVISPPVALLGPPSSSVVTKKEKIILSIGRFTPHGHSKRQDLIVKAMKKAIQAPELAGWRLVLCGVVPNNPESIAYYEEIARQCKTMPASVVLAPTRQELESLLRKASVYISATGADVTKAADYAKCEHFGITVVEAASTGAIPVAYSLGGPADIIEQLGVGVTYRSPRTMSDALVKAVKLSQDVSLREKLAFGSQQYSDASFQQQWQRLVRELTSA